MHNLKRSQNLLILEVRMVWNSVRHLPAGNGATPVSDAVLKQAESQIEGCGRCDTSSDVSFGAMLKFFVRDRQVESLALKRPPKCPNCDAVLSVTSLVSWD